MQTSHLFSRGAILALLACSSIAAGSSTAPPGAPAEHSASQAAATQPADVGNIELNGRRTVRAMASAAMLTAEFVGLREPADRLQAQIRCLDVQGCGFGDAAAAVASVMPLLSTAIDRRIESGQPATQDERLQILKVLVAVTETVGHARPFLEAARGAELARNRTLMIQTAQATQALTTFAALPNRLRALVSAEAAAPPSR